MLSPSCAVIIPVYNSTKARLTKLDACLASLTRQTTPVVGIVVDDGSPMRRDVELLVKEHGARCRLRYVERTKPQKEANTSAGALNFGFRLVLDADDQILGAKEISEIKALCYIHSDDLLPQSSIEMRMAGLRSGGFAWGRQLIFYEADRTLAPWNRSNAYTLRKPTFTHHSALWSLALLRNAFAYVEREFGQDGIFDTALPCCEDWDASITIADCAKNISMSGSFVDKYVYYYRKHEDSITSSIAMEQWKMAHDRILAKHRLNSSIITIPLLTRDLPWSLFCFLPERRKKTLRGFRDSVKRIIPGRTVAFEFPEEVLADPSLLSYKPKIKT